MFWKWDLESFKKRRNIKYSNNPQEDFLKFKQRIINTFSGIDALITTQGVEEFCIIFWINITLHSDYLWGYTWTNINDHLHSANTVSDICLILEVIYQLPSNISFEVKKKFKILFEQILPFSNINCRIIEADNKLVSYPAGEDILDEAIINTILSFLDSKSNKLFEDALKEYEGWRGHKSGESLRKGIEEFLRYKLNNDKQLLANKWELFKKIKEKGWDKQITNIIESIFSYLDIYFNENTKHKTEVISEEENEFLIYQVWLLLRYISKIL